ncbi:MAG TPA: hypothetical protein PJ982_15695 [Lacipirellulaceae bacterium]|nr:hypothetical protein [Lacipirellulaceae bacterium]
MTETAPNPTLAEIAAAERRQRDAEQARSKAAEPPAQFRLGPAADPLGDEVRELVIAAVEAGKLAKGDATKINDLLSLRGKPVAAIAAALQEASAAFARGEGNLSEFAAEGAAGVLFRIVANRKRLADQFAKTAYSKRLADLQTAYSEAAARLQAAENDPMTPRPVTWRLRDAANECHAALTRAMNSSDPELLAFRAALKPTADPTRPAVDWRNFSI